jgi:hypothetical protein
MQCGWADSRGGDQQGGDIGRGTKILRSIIGGFFFAHIKRTDVAAGRISQKNLEKDGINQPPGIHEQGLDDGYW